MEIDITLSSADMNTLKDEGFALYAFKAVKTAQGGGAPLVWFRTTNLLTTTKVTWEDEYQAYISNDEIIANGKVSASTSVDIKLGQTVNVSNNGIVTTTSDGMAGAVSIQNRGNTPYTTGIAQMANGTANPMCAIPLHGVTLDVVIPIQKVLLLFASNTVNTGIVIYKAFSSGFVVDLTDPKAAGMRKVTYVVNKGWTADDGGTWATQIDPGASLLPILITT